MNKGKNFYKLKKILTASLCLVSIFSLLTFNSDVQNLSYAAESGYSDDQDNNDNKEEKETSKAAVVLTVIAVFTITAAVTAVLTYKKRVKSKK